MNCRNCGAAMEFVAARNHFRCAYCETIHVPEPLDEGVVVTDQEHRLSCTRCAVRVMKGSIEGKPVAYCTTCRGFLTTSEHFAVIVRMRRARRPPGAVEVEPLDTRELRKVTRCPRCARPMQTHPYGGGGTAVIDSCMRCHLVWLDSGELTALERFTPPRPV